MADSYVGYAPADKMLQLAAGAVTATNLATTGTASSSTYLRGDMAWASNPLGDVIGPGSSTDNALAKFDSTTGAVIQNSNAILSDAGVLTVSSVAGDLTGDVTGNVSGTSATVTGATQAAITTTANLATVGTIGTGVWEGTDVAIAHGGTGASRLLPDLPIVRLPVPSHHVLRRLRNGDHRRRGPLRIRAGYPVHDLRHPERASGTGRGVHDGRLHPTADPLEGEVADGRAGDHARHQPDNHVWPLHGHDCWTHQDHGTGPGTHRGPAQHRQWPGHHRRCLCGLHGNGL